MARNAAHAGRDIEMSMCAVADLGYGVFCVPLNRAIASNKRLTSK